MRTHPAVLRAGLRAVRPLFASQRIPLGTKRTLVDAIAASSRPPGGTLITQDVVAGVPVERLRGPGPLRNGKLIYLHGGGYALGTAKGYRGLAARLAIATGFEVISVEYSRAPEAPFPLALQEAREVFLAVASRQGSAERVVVAGDSAGGGLALALAKCLRDEGSTAPAGLGLICPWLDLAKDAAGERANRTDPLIEVGMIRDWVVPYAGSDDVKHPLISPVHGDLAGLPPIVMHSAGDDPIAVDADLLQQRLDDNGEMGGRMLHRRYPGLWHVFHLQAGFLAAADAAVVHLGDNLRLLAEEGRFAQQ